MQYEPHTANFYPDDYARLQELAKESGVGVSTIIRSIVHDALKGDDAVADATIRADKLQRAIDRAVVSLTKHDLDYSAAARRAIRRRELKR